MMAAVRQFKGQQMNIRRFAGHQPQLGERVFVDASAVVLGDVELGEDCSVWPMAVIRGDMHRIRIGARTSVQDGSVLHITHAGPFNPDGYPLIIGDDVTIGHKVLLHGCTVGSRVLIGMGSIVMDGAVIEDEVLLGAGSLVPANKRLRSGYLYMGSPAKVLRALTEREREVLIYTAANYARRTDQYRNGGNSARLHPTISGREAVPGKRLKNAPHADGGLEQEDSRALLRVIYLVTGLTIGFFGILQALNGRTPLATVEACACLLLLIGAVCLGRVRNLTPWIYLYLLPTYSFLIYIIVMPEASVSAFVWVFMIPVMTYL